jgi:hypothetical protein
MSQASEAWWAMTMFANGRLTLLRQSRTRFLAQLIASEALTMPSAR